MASASPRGAQRDAQRGRHNGAAQRGRQGAAVECAAHTSDRGEVDIMRPSEGHVAGSIPAGRTNCWLARLSRPPSTRPHLASAAAARTPACSSSPRSVLSPEAHRALCASETAAGPAQQPPCFPLARSAAGFWSRIDSSRPLSQLNLPASPTSRLERPSGDQGRQG